ncbi:hypothetical protein [Pseudomonas monteilii]|uniref:hypothetical protein n=1 Tax=Pseudomonas monteilii TaxID=76759 RepID=UPI00048DE344|nr:hypothetical protein [Pseudomonas monteilii]MCE1021148.1 hypothetical protein [Pseudomonas monteilii]HCF2575851.1 hypothetical protein [Pseudomonas aeruginosa]
MTQRYRFPSGELVPGLVLPPEIQRRLRLLLASIQAANSPVNCLIAQACAQGACLGLDMGHVLLRSDIERVEILVDNIACQRLTELAADALP